LKLFFLTCLSPQEERKRYNKNISVFTARSVQPRIEDLTRELNDLDQANAMHFVNQAIKQNVRLIKTSEGINVERDKQANKITPGDVRHGMDKSFKTSNRERMNVESNDYAYIESDDDSSSIEVIAVKQPSNLTKQF